MSTPQLSPTPQMSIKQMSILPISSDLAQDWMKFLVTKVKTHHTNTDVVKTTIADEMFD